jgi:hypothetical protein
VTIAHHVARNITIFSKVGVNIERVLVETRDVRDWAGESAVHYAFDSGNGITKLSKTGVDIERVLIGARDVKNKKKISLIDWVFSDIDRQEALNALGIYKEKLEKSISSFPAGIALQGRTDKENKKIITSV